MSHGPYVRYIHAFVHGCRIGVLVEVGTETDYLTKSPEFEAWVHDIAIHIAGKGPADLGELMGQQFVKDETKSIRDLVREARTRFREHIEIMRFVRWDNEIPLRTDIPTPPKAPAVIMRFDKK